MTTSQRYWSSRPVRYWQAAASSAPMPAPSLYAGTTTDTGGLAALRAAPSGPPPAGRDFVSDPVIESVMFIASLLLSSEGTPPAPSEASARSRRPRENRPSAPRGRAPERTLEAQRKPYEAQPQAHVENDEVPRRGRHGSEHGHRPDGGGEGAEPVERRLTEKEPREEGAPEQGEVGGEGRQHEPRTEAPQHLVRDRRDRHHALPGQQESPRQEERLQIAGADAHARSEERRVGKECRSRWSPYH